MADWVHLFPLMVLGLCDAFDRFSRGNNVHPLKRCEFTEGADPPAVNRPIENPWFYNGKHNPDEFHPSRRRSQSFGSSAELHSNSKHPGTWSRDSFPSKLSDHNSMINDLNSFKNRRFLWEPILDGNVIGSIGNLFSDSIKEEADKERIEREKLREEKLLKKYTTMLEDPNGLAELKKESENSPNYINQIVRRSFVPDFDEEDQETVAMNSPPQDIFDFEDWGRFRSNYHRRNNGHVSSETGNGNLEEPPQSQMIQNPDTFGYQNQEITDYPCPHVLLVLIINPDVK